MLVEVENVNSMTSGGGGATSGSQTLSSELRQSAESTLLTGAEAVTVQTLNNTFNGGILQCG